MTTLTIRTIEKLYSAPIEVKLYNGNFNVASVRVTNNKVSYELTVEDTHDMLRPMSICKEPKTTFVVWNTLHTGDHESMPDCLKELEQKLLDATKMSDEYALKLHKRMTNLMLELYAEMGWTK